MSTNVTLFVVIGTVVFLTLACFVTLLLYLFQQRQHIFQKEKEELASVYHKEILKAQLEMQEQTFLSISQEIHDNIGQILSLTRLHISTISPDDYVATERKVGASKELIDKAIGDLRDLSKRLNAGFVRQQALSESLKFQLNLIQKTELFATSFELHGEEKALDPEKKLIVFRIAQEALNNIIKHAQAKTISVVLMYLADKTILSIKDDGRGFDASRLSDATAPRTGIGTHNMSYRATLIGGHFVISSEPGAGTLAQLVLPASA